MGQPNVGDKRLNLDLEAGTKQSQGVSSRQEMLLMSSAAE